MHGIISRLLPLVVLLALGCGGGAGDTLTVTGTVGNADGSAFEAPNGGLVLFQPVGEGKPATGNLASDGTFTTETGSPEEGIKHGTYKVVLQIWKDYRAGKLAVPEKYGKPETTPLEVTVDADHTHFDFKVEGK
jgi:hypothetical protein